ncbi:MAG: hypothetical protein JSW23_05645 [Planctomycetota bacterium]|nr:MAG: hypothetical protein JSW23_05645 [Planctomycetota bacterium]
MERVWINRYEGDGRCVFLSCSVEKVGLKELLELKWQRTFDLHFSGPIRPEWMRSFKDY